MAFSLHLVVFTFLVSESGVTLIEIDIGKDYGYDFWAGVPLKDRRFVV